MARLGGAFVVLLAVVAFVPTIIGTTSATEFVVGDDSGWKLGFDYQAWAKDKVFYVGDKLVFKYPVGAHTVFKVNGTMFQSCTKPPLNAALTTGNDVIVLATPGRKWYICGVGSHCNLGQKLVITVFPQPWVAPSAPPSSVPGWAAPTPSSVPGWVAPSAPPSSVPGWAAPTPSSVPGWVAPAPSSVPGWTAPAPTPVVHGWAMTRSTEKAKRPFVNF